MVSLDIWKTNKKFVEKKTSWILFPLINYFEIINDFSSKTSSILMLFMKSSYKNHQKQRKLVNYLKKWYFYFPFEKLQLLERNWNNIYDHISSTATATCSSTSTTDTFNLLSSIFRRPTFQADSTCIFPGCLAATKSILIRQAFRSKQAAVL